MEDYVQSMNEYFSIMKEAGFDEYTHEARELFDDFVSQTDSVNFAATTLVKLRKDVDNARKMLTQLADERTPTGQREEGLEDVASRLVRAPVCEESTDDKNLFECFKNVIRENISHYMSIWKKKEKINGELSEDFIYKHFRCLDCGSRISKERPGTKCFDHTCMRCGKKYQTKGRAKSLNALKNCIDKGEFTTTGSDYKTRLNSVRNRECDFICVFYETKGGVADSLTGILHVPAHKITEDNVIPCKPLEPPARRAGYQGCNILMTSFNVLHLE